MDKGMTAVILYIHGMLLSTSNTIIVHAHLRNNGARRLLTSAKFLSKALMPVSLFCRLIIWAVQRRLEGA
jgi:hypothetical protein